MQRTEKQDIYTRITNQIVSHLEKGVRPWVRPWNAEHAAGRITRPLRHNGKPYSGINVLSLWASAMAQNFAAPIWMTFKQALELDADIRKGEKGSLVVYADSIMRKRNRQKKTGDPKSIGKSRHSSRGTRLSMSSRSKGCRKFITRKPRRYSTLCPAGRSTRKSSSRLWETKPSGTAATARFTASLPMQSRCRCSRASRTPIGYYAILAHEMAPTGQAARPGSTVTSAGIASGAKVTRSRNWLPNLGPLSSAPTWSSLF